MTKTEKLFVALWRSHKLNVALDVLKQFEPDHCWRSVNRQPNNMGTINLASAVVPAITEGVTNGLDAVIMHAAANKRLKNPETVKDALSQISGPHVDVYWQEASGISTEKTVTILDRGTGMTESQMLSGVLAFGSEDKPLNPIQHGSYGQGGSTLFAICKGTLIASRVDDSDSIVFTFVCLRELPSGLLSYCYATTKDGHLFKADATKLPLVDPDRTRVLTDVAKELAKWRPEIGGEEGILFPEHGTVRRQFGVNIAHSAGTGSGESLWRGLRDNLFASNGVIRLIGDRISSNNGKVSYKTVDTVCPARSKFRDTLVGERITKEGPRLYDFTDETPVNVEVGKTPSGPDMRQVDIEVYAFDAYYTKFGEKCSILRDYIDGGAKEGIKNVFITLNGQTHYRMSMHNVWPAKYPWIKEHVIVHVMLDRLPSFILQQTIVSNREALKGNLATKLREIIKDFLENGPCAHYLTSLNEKMVPSASLNSGISKSTALLANAFSQSKVVGAILGRIGVGNGRGASSNGAKVSGSAPGKGNGGTGSAGADFELFNKPTMIEIRKDDVVRGKEEWVTVRVNAYDHLDKEVNLILPSGFNLVPGCKPLRKGRKSYHISCPANAPDNVSFTATFGSKLRISKDVLVLDDRPKAPKAPAHSGNRESAPTPKYIEVHFNDVKDPNRDKFDGAKPGSEFFNYSLSGDEVYIFHNVDFQPLKDIFNMLARIHGSFVVPDVQNRLIEGLAALAILNLDQSVGIGPGGATSEQEFTYLERAAMSHLIMLGRIYEDKGLLKAIEVASRQKDDGTGRSRKSANESDFGDFDDDISSDTEEDTSSKPLNCKETMQEKVVRLEKRSADFRRGQRYQ